MTFSIDAVGSREHVARQLRKHTFSAENHFGRALALLAARQIESNTPSAWDGYEVAYVVTASGHSGPFTAVSLELSISAHYVPAAPEPAESTPGNHAPGLVSGACGIDQQAPAGDERA